MDIQARYQAVLSELALGGRGLQRLTSEEIDELIAALKGSAATPALCLITHAAFPDRRFEAPLLEYLQRGGLSAEETVYALNAARKHIMQARFKEGLRLEGPFLERLRLLLAHPDLDVIEWVLRTIEECGGQSVIFAKDVARLRPSVFSLWRAKSRTILELVTLLQRRWGPPGEGPRI